MARGTQCDKSAHAGNPKPSCTQRIDELEEALRLVLGDYDRRRQSRRGRILFWLLRHT